MKALIPISKAKTAYGLLSEVVKLVLDEPKRMRMEIWGGGKNSANYLGNPKDRPVCGTIGCIGGWLEHQGRSQNSRKNAWTLLGFTGASDNAAIDRLFYGNLCCDPMQGTPQHARRVVRLIRKFQRTHKARLLRTKGRDR